MAKDFRKAEIVVESGISFEVFPAINENVFSKRMKQDFIGHGFEYNAQKKRWQRRKSDSFGMDIT
jgi:hypothetical protein